MKKLLLLLSMIIAVAACKQAGNDFEEIKTLREDFRKNGEKDMAKAEELDKAYKAYIVANAHDTIVPTLLYEDADLNIRSFNKIDEGLKLYAQLYTDYPQHRLAPDAMFTSAFIYENSLANREKAKALYEEYLKKYPDHHFADDATQTLRYWDKPEGEMLQEILEKAAKDTSGL